MTAEPTIRTLNDLLDAAARARPRPGTLATPQTRLSYGDLRDQVLRTAAGMHAAGIGRGDRVAIVLRNGIPFVVSYFALARLGAVAVPINFMVQKPADLAFMFQDCTAKAIVTQRDFLPALRAAALLAPSVRHIWVSGPGHGAQAGVAESPFAELGADGPQEPPATTVSESDLAGILYTAGTTGVPKGVMLTHRNLVSNCLAGAAHMGLRRNDVMLCILPMFHAFAWTANILVPMSMSANVAIAPSVTPARIWLRLMARQGVTIFTAVPPILTVLASKATGFNRLLLRWWYFRRVRLAVSGAAPLHADTARRFTAAFGLPLCEGYGLTETSPMAAINPIDRPRPGTVGLALPGVSIRIADPEGRPLPPGTDGEVCIRGDCVMLGYLNQPAATAEVISPDGWFRTGDIGCLDADGYLTIKDRIKDMIIVKGLKVFPAQVEAALLEHPAVAEAAVIGVPDETGDETVKGFVVLHPGAAVGRGELLRHCRGRLDGYKRPRAVDIVAELPRNTLRKVLKRVLREGELARRGRGAGHGNGG